MGWGKGILRPRVLTEYRNVTFTDFQSSWCQRMQVLIRYFPGGSVVKNLPANAGDLRDPGSIPGLEDPLKKEMATHSSIVAWRIPWTESLVGFSPWHLKELDMTEHHLLATEV